MSVNYNILDTILKKYTNNLLDNIYIFVYKFSPILDHYPNFSGIIIYECNLSETNPLFNDSLNREDIDILRIIFMKEIDNLFWRFLHYVRKDDIITKYIEKYNSNADSNEDVDFGDVYGEDYNIMRDKMVKEDITYLDDNIIDFMRNISGCTYHDNSLGYIQFELDKYKYTYEKELNKIYLLK